MTAQTVPRRVLGQIEQLIAVQHPLGMVEKHPQQPILRPAEGDDGAAVVQQMTGGGIEQPVAKDDQPARLGDLQVSGSARVRRKMALMRASSSRATKGLIR